MEIRVKKNKTLRAALILCLIAILTLILVSGTFAKYTKAFTSSDNARVARFDVTAGGMADGDLDLFNTAYTTGSDTNVLSSNTKNVVAPGTSGSFDVAITNKSEVAVKASIACTKTEATEVPVIYVYNGKYYSDYTFASLSDLTVPATFANDAAAGTKATITLEGDFEKMVTDMNANTNLTRLAPNQTAAVGSANSTVSWFWPFEAGTMTNETSQQDAPDTAFGVKGNGTTWDETKMDTVELNFTVKATQLD